MAPASGRFTGRHSRPKVAWICASSAARSTPGWPTKPQTFQVRVDGRLIPGVTPKDIILALIAKIGIGGGTGHVIEYTGEAIRSLSMEGRMTVCNMSIEGGVWAGLVAPDDTTFDYLHGRTYAPQDRPGTRRWRVPA